MNYKTGDMFSLAGIYTAAVALASVVSIGALTGAVHLMSEDATVTVNHVASDCREVLNSNIFKTGKNCVIDTDKGTFTVGHRILSLFYGSGQQAMIDQLKTGKTYNITHNGESTIFKLTPID